MDAKGLDISLPGEGTMDIVRGKGHKILCHFKENDPGGTEGTQHSQREVVSREVTLPASTCGWFGGSPICQWGHVQPLCTCLVRQWLFPSQLDSRDRPVWLG